MLFIKTKKKLYKWDVKGFAGKTARLVLVTTVMLAVSINLDGLMIGL